jgi:hypothetical protein
MTLCIKFGAGTVYRITAPTPPPQKGAPFLWLRLCISVATSYSILYCILKFKGISRPLDTKLYSVRLLLDHEGYFFLVDFAAQKSDSGLLTGRYVVREYSVGLDVENRWDRILNKSITLKE